MDLMLEGIKVLDFTNNIAGPTCAALLGERGAEVIKVEKPKTGDDARYYLPLVDGQSPTHLWVNRNKKSLVLDMKDPEAKELIYKMVKDFDILIEAYKPGVMDKLGFSYEKLHEINPKLIYCSISAFGHSGPYQDRPGYDVIAQAYSGVMYRTGEPGKSPNRLGLPLGDTVSAMNAFGSILGALYYREKTGKGQHVDISLARTMLWQQMMLKSSLIPGKEFTREGNHSSSLCPYGIFNGNDDSIIIACGNDTIWQKVCDGIGREDLKTDPRFAKQKERVTNRLEVIKIIEDWLKAQPSMNEAEAKLKAAGAPCIKVYNEPDLIADEQARSENWIAEIPMPASVKSREFGLGPVGLSNFSECDIINNGAPEFGDGNYEIFGRYGYSKEAVDALEDKWASESPMS